MSNCRQTGWSSSFASASGCGRWSPFEIAATVLGFVVFWPLGLTLLCAKLWQRNSGAQGDLFSFLREQAHRVREAVFAPAAPDSVSATPFWGSSGNAAFDEWRESELRRLEAERRKLAEAEREFAKHIEELRRARDREEFESFMRGRGQSRAG